MPVQIGFHSVSHTVPAHYQASVFPAFGAFVATLGLDALTPGRPWRSRAVLVLAISALAVLRLLGLLPLSGHGVAVAALITHDLTAPREIRTPFGVALSTASLAVTAWYKLWVWGDAFWLGVSILAGALIAAVCGASRRWGAKTTGRGRTP